MMFRKKLCLVIFLSGSILFSCDEETSQNAVPIPPILKDVVFPNTNSISPGQETQINGKGFSQQDEVTLIGSTTFTATVTAVTDQYIRFIVPADAAGNYQVAITRDGQQSILDGVLQVPFIIVLEDVELPEAIQRGEQAEIVGEGFEEGDVIRFTASFYPNGKEYQAVSTLSADGVSFTVPTDVYGVNSIVVVRGTRQTSLGTLIVEANVGDEIGGGVVYWVNANKAHGYITARVNVGTAIEQFGPEVAPGDAAGTSKAVGAGLQNTQNIVAKMAQLRAANDWPEWRNTKIAAELCDEYSVTVSGLTYTDWFLPSREELIELFKVKALMATKGAEIGNNNFWSSSEGDGGAAGWSAFYVNFYEATNIVSNSESKSGWKIGVRPVRSF